MRVQVDHEAGMVHLSFGGPQGDRVEVAEGVVVARDAGGRVVGVEVRGIEAAALADLSVALGPPALPDSAASLVRAAPAVPANPSPLGSSEPVRASVAHVGPVGWDPEAEAAVLRAPFFRRGPLRLAAVALARKRGLDRVTPDLLRDVVI